jgi:predicted transcriptional regulator
MATKHEQIIQYIETMPVGEKLSVRTIAKNLNMSEGTAYRAIKDAENIGRHHPDRTQIERKH